MKKPIREYKRNGQQFAYILDSIEPEEIELNNDAEKIRYILDRFNAEFNYLNNKRRYRNLQERIGNWLQGLPGEINIAFTDSDIIKLGKTWGYCQTERKAAEFVFNYWNVMAFRLLQIADYYGINYSYLY